MQALLTVIVTWLSINFGLPAIDEHPRVEFVSAAKMAEVRHDRLASNRAGRVAAEAGRPASPEFGRDVYAIYDDEGRTIYLPKEWAGTTPAEISVLVHELVHHLQNVAGLKYECPQAREELAYRAQARWLALFGRSLADEFDLNATTIFVRTRCMH